MTKYKGLNTAANKEKIAIVCVGYNRIDSIKRLYSSLLDAFYPNDDIPLIFSIDASGDQALYDYVQQVEWPHGEKYVNIEQNRLGLKNHIFQCGDLTRYFKAIILLEDDLYVSPSFYYYTAAAVDKYGDNRHVAGISLYSSDMNGFAGLPFIPLKTESDVFAWQTVVSWGQCWTEQMWSGFRDWYDQNVNFDMSVIDMHLRIKQWKRAWSKFYYSYIISHNLFFIIPYDSFTTNFSDLGEHNSVSNVNHMVQMRLLYGKKEAYTMSDFETLPRYDVYANPLGLESYLGLPGKSLCVDFYHDHASSHRYLLTTKIYNYKVIRQYSLSLQPLK